MALLVRRDPSALDLVQKYGRDPTSAQVLGPTFSHFRTHRSLIGYVDTGHAWVAAAMPIGPDEERNLAADAFFASARQHRRRAHFFGTPAAWAAEFPTKARLPIGEMPRWSSRGWRHALASHASLRGQLSRARNKNIEVECLAEASRIEGARDEIEALARSFVFSRAMAPMRFLVDVTPFENSVGRVFWLARQEGRALGFATALPVPASAGWFVEHVVRHRGAPNGTVELMIDRILHDAQSNGIEEVTMGMVPLAGSVCAPLRMIRRWAKPLYDFEGLLAFKQKLVPDSWEPVYLVTRHLRVLALYDVLHAFAGGSFFEFGWHTVRKQLARIRPRGLLGTSH